MDSVPENEILEFPKDVLQVVRREYDLDKPGRMDQAIDVLDAWIKMQNHFTRKEFPRDYLERQIIFCKGSVERTKQRMDRNFTLKNMVPVFYKTINLKTDYKDSYILFDAILPKLTDDYYRIYVLKNIGQRFIHGATDYFRFILLMAEYIVSYDYTKGIVIVLDYMDTNMYEFVKAIDVIEFRQAINMLLGGYGMRIKGIHMITASKAVVALVTIFKQILSTKLSDRIQVHKNYESLHTVVSKDLLPVELGGNGRSIIELHVTYKPRRYIKDPSRKESFPILKADNILVISLMLRKSMGEDDHLPPDQWVDVLNSEKHQAYFQEMRKASTNENFRQTDKLNEEYLGTPGTFRTLSLD